MSAGHMIKYHVAIPAAIFGVLALAGVPLATAFFIGMMAGCAGMMVMMATMAGGGHERSNADRAVDDHAPR